MSFFKQCCCVFRWMLQFENQEIVTLVLFLTLILKCGSFSYFPCSATTNQTFHRLCDINLHGADTSMQVL